MAERTSKRENVSEDQSETALLFDYDGVLVYSEAFNYVYYTDVYNRAMEFYDDPTIHMPSVEDITKCFPLGLEDAIKILTPPQHTDKIPQIVEIAQLTPRYEELLRHPRYIDIVIPKLRAKHKLAIVTNAKETALRAFFNKYPDLEECFDSIITEAGKPEPDGILEALENLNTSPNNAALAGDTPHTDGEAASRAKVQFFHIARWKLPAEGADLVATDVYDLYRLLDADAEDIVALEGLQKTLGYKP
jgi:HAD superfamily hydrolase (TIGR01549 family)